LIPFSFLIGQYLSEPGWGRSGAEQNRVANPSLIYSAEHSLHVVRRNNFEVLPLDLKKLRENVDLYPNPLKGPDVILGKKQRWNFRKSKTVTLIAFLCN
jgi:hypothetical protein